MKNNKVKFLAIFAFLVFLPSIAFSMEITPECGNSVCDFNETCISCSKDCGSCPPLNISTSVINVRTETIGGEVNIIIPSIDAMKNVTIGIPEETNLSVINFTLGVNTAIKNVNINIKTVTRKNAPDLITIWKTYVYQYLSIETENITIDDIRTLLIDFRIEKNWIDANKFDKSLVKLFRYNENMWESIPILLMGEDENNIYYRASSPGFSIFALSYLEVATPAKESTIYEEWCGNAICSEEKGETQVNCCLDCGCSTNYECVNNICNTVIASSVMLEYLIYIVITVIIFLLAIYFLVRNYRKMM